MVKVKILSGKTEVAAAKATNAFLKKLATLGIMYEVRAILPFVNEREGKYCVLVQYWQGEHLR